jgi:hypothetical protein
MYISKECSCPSLVQAGAEPLRTGINLDIKSSIFPPSLSGKNSISCSKMDYSELYIARKRYSLGRCYYFSYILFAGLMTLLILPLGNVLVEGFPYAFEYEQHNLNQNRSAQNPVHYWGKWEDHFFHPSPENWRIPFYTLFLDRFVNGDPSNDNANKTLYEHDSTSSILRHGGDITGLVDSLDYLQGKECQNYPLCCVRKSYFE